MKRTSPFSVLRLLSSVTAVLCLLASAPLARAAIADHVVRSTIAGVDVVAYKTGVQDVVTFRGSLPAGDSFSPAENLAIATLTGGMLDKGTTTQDKFAIAQKLDAVGAELTFAVDDTMLVFSGKCLSKDVPLVISLLAEQLRSPAFSEEEFTKLKKQIAGRLQRALEQTGYRAGQAFAASVYPPGHPNYEPSTDAFLAALNTATVADLRAFHAKYYGPAELTLVAVGDVDIDALKADVTKAFAGWSGGVKHPDYPRIATEKDFERDQTVFMADKPNVSVILGQASGLRYTDPDALPLRVATTILGSGFTGRLMATVRDQEGLTYGIGARIGNDTFTEGDWRIIANFAPDLLEKGLASTRRELKSWYEQGVTSAEVDRTKTNLAGSFQVGLATTDGLAGAILTTIHRGYPLGWLDDYTNNLNAVTLDQVNAAIKKHLNPDNFVLIKAGSVPTIAK
ncbi:M16 family metallopeptidase [Rariglobus hedericola]|uniref:Insulinase family protein n=1 Tax=Rariglobus hedericola TaxID=2597822 RepID=A0A556QSP6_9BACT|nr:pitrilysin family protein [Rariglobus hedericola]TSJ79643.1 insulinase family protein [Rariglobus hedericola]